MSNLLSEREEVEALLSYHPGPTGMAGALNVLANQFNVLQGRSQLLLSLSTLVLTITGFSGPKIAATNALARWMLAVGIFIVLLSTAFTLIQTLSVRWTTQFKGATDADTLEGIVRNRNRKTRFFVLSITLLVIGLACYVGSIIVFLLCYQEA
ncbi:MAG: hypothetical protein ACFUZC_16025 [Chthoniobacteraceae bacterium]